MAAQRRETQMVADMHAFAGHIACDPDSRSDGSLFGVWDVDSPQLKRFDTTDRVGMEALCIVFMRSLGAGGA